MANTKISQLPSATTPVVGTEVLPIVQSSATSKVSIANLTAGRDVSASTYAVTGFTLPTNGVYLNDTNSLAITTNGLRTATFTNLNNFDVGTGNTVAGQRFIQASNLSTDPAASALLVAKSDSQIFQLVTYSSAYPPVGAIPLASKAQLYAGGSAGSSGLQIWDGSSTPQIDFILGSTVAGTFSNTFNLDIGTGSSANTTRYVRAKNSNTGSSAAASVYSQSDAQILQILTYSSTYPVSSTIPLAGKGVLYAGGVSGSSGLQIWDNSAAPQIDFIVGGASSTAISATINSSGNWSFSTKAVSGISTLTANSFIPNGSSVPTNGMYLPSANTVSIATNSAVTASFTSAGNFDVGTGNTTNAVRFVRAQNLNTGSSAYATVYSQSNTQIAQLQAYSSTYPSASGITLASKAVLYASGSGSSGLTFWDNSDTPDMQFVVGTTSAGTINSSAVLSLTNNPILSGGTANGVAYLNGSKVLTTGSALTFSGSKLEISSSGEQLKLTSSGDFSSTGTGFLRFYDSVGAKGFVGYGGTASRFDINTGSSMNLNMNAVGGTMTFQISNGEQMRLTSTGLGIGETSPSYKLDIKGAANSAALTLLRLNNSGTTGGGPGIASRISFTAGATALGYIQGSNFASGASGLQFSGDGTNAQATLDSSGNLGLGVTPSAWSGIKPYQAGTAASFSGGSGFNDAFIASNAFYDGSNWKYINTNPAYYSSVGGAAAARWYTAPSGTAGDAITFTQAMTLDASGNLLVGTTSSSYTADGGFRVIYGASGNTYVASTRSGSTNSDVTLLVRSTGAAADRFYVGMGGTVFATSIVISAISDQRLKENIRDIDTGLDAIMALKPRRFDWKEGKGQDKKNAAGFIAQEFEEVFPECVDLSRPDDEGVEYKNINHETLIPTLVKAIQEQQALIESLTTRLAALEAK